MVKSIPVKPIIIFSLSIISSFLAGPPLFAGGELIKLKAIADSMALQEQVLKKEEANYNKAQAFIGCPDIKKGLSQDAVLERCGAPVAKVRDGRQWVYKPPSATFFKGDKIYFVFDSDGRLAGWEKVYQK